MQILVLNQTSNTLSYVNGQISVPANGQAPVTSGLIPYLILDPNFRNNIGTGSVQISDTVNIFTGKDAIDYLNLWLNLGPPQNSNDPIAFTLAGMGFSVTASASINSTTATALLLLTNPSNSGVNARAMFFYAAPNATQGIVTATVYSNPTVTNNGTQLPIQNNLVSSSAPASSMVAYGAPTVSSPGTPRITFVSNSNADSSLFDFSQTAILAPGNSMLLEVSVSNLGLLASVTTYFFLQWVEA